MSEKKSSFEPEEEHENLERWLLTYADMITLLTAFFILLYSMSVLNIAKFQKLAVSVRSGFNGTQQPVSGPSIVEKGQVNLLGPASEQLDEPSKARAPLNLRQGPPARMAAPLPGEADLLAKAKTDLKGHGAVHISTNRSGWVVELAGEEIFFKKDSAVLTKPSELVLLDLARIIPRFVSLVGVEGFSGSSPSAGFSLSSRRALAVLEVLQKGGVSEEKLSATGFGVHAPTGLGGRDYVRIVIKR